MKKLLPFILILFCSNTLNAQREDSVMFQYNELLPRDTVEKRTDVNSYTTSFPKSITKFGYDHYFIDYQIWSDTPSKFIDTIIILDITCEFEGDTMLLDQYLENAFEFIPFCQELRSLGTSAYRIHLSKLGKVDSLEILREDPCDYWQDRFDESNSEKLLKSLQRVTVYAENRESLIIYDKKHYVSSD